MTFARRLALPAALCALLALPLAISGPAGATETCTTAIGGGPVTDGFDAPASTACAAAVLLLTPNPAVPQTEVTLDGSQSVGGDLPAEQIARYEWDFGDGDTLTTDAPEASVRHAYDRGGYTASLTIVTGDGTPLDTATADVVVDTAPVAALGAPGGTLRPGVAYDFDASGSAAPDAGASLVRYDWDWGDGTTTPNGGPSAQHTYARDVAATVTVTVYDDLGLSDAATAGVTVANVLPLVQLIATPATVQVGEQLTLDAAGSSDPDGSIVRYCWDLNATNAFATCTGLTSSVTAGPYPNPGLLTLRVKVYDDSGGASVKGVPVTVVRAPSTGGGGDTGGGSGGGDGSSGDSGAGSGSGSGSGGSTGSGGSAHDPFAVGLSGAAIQKLKAALRRGIGLRAVANRAASGRLTVTVAARDAKRLRLPGRRGRRPVAIGTLKLSLSAGRTAKPAIKLTRGAARALRRAKPSLLRVTIRGSIAAGAETAAVVRVVLLRG